MFGDVFEIAQNSNRQLEQLTAYLKNDLEVLKQKNPNPKFVDIKEKQIKMLEGAFDGFEHVIELLNTLIDAIELNEKNLNEKIFKLEGACLYHGLTPFDITMFCSRPAKEIGDMVQQAYEEGWRQKPLVFCEPIMIKPDTEIKFSDKPIIPFHTLKKMATNG